MCFYAGHGVLDETTQIVLPTEAYCVRKNPYPLELRLRQLKVIDQLYIVGVLDCCRQALKQPIVLQEQQSIP